jgi:hypothetical protein
MAGKHSGVGVCYHGHRRNDIAAVVRVDLAGRACRKHGIGKQQ